MLPGAIHTKQTDKKKAAGTRPAYQKWRQSPITGAATTAIT